MGRKLFFPKADGKLVCLIWKYKATVAKEYNMCRYCWTMQLNKYDKFSGKFCKEKVNQKQSTFSKSLSH